MKARTRFELVITVLQTIALPLGYRAVRSGLRGSNSLPPPWQGGALPDELNPHMNAFAFISATWMGLEPTTSAVTGRRSNQLNYQAMNGNNRARTCDPLLVRQMLSQLSYAPIAALALVECFYIILQLLRFVKHFFRKNRKFYIFSSFNFSCWVPTCTLRVFHQE